MDTNSKLALALIVIAGLWGLAVWQRDLIARLYEFLGEAKIELKKVTWPRRREVVATTSVVLVTVFVFGVFLSTVDLIFTWSRTELFKALGL
jgi:preprotein translocase subunit SecE